MRRATSCGSWLIVDVLAVLLAKCILLPLAAHNATNYIDVIFHHGTRIVTPAEVNTSSSIRVEVEENG